MLAFLGLDTGLRLSLLMGKTIPSSDSEVVESELESDWNPPPENSVSTFGIIFQSRAGASEERVLGVLGPP